MCTEIHDHVAEKFLWSEKTLVNNAIHFPLLFILLFSLSIPSLEKRWMTSLISVGLANVMLSSIKSLFHPVATDTNLESNADLIQSFSRSDDRAALSDGNFDETERVQLGSTITKKWKLAGPVVTDLIKLAEQQQDLSTSLFEHTHVINQCLSREEKIGLIDCLWEIAFADGRVDHFEENTIRKIADLIYVDHKDFIKSKIRVRDH